MGEGRQRRRGVSIGASLVAVALIAFIGFTLAGLSVTHLHMVSRTSASQQARHLATSAVSEGMAYVLANSAFGTLDSSDEDLTVELKGSPGVGRLTFRQATASDWGIPYSVNNIDGTGSVRGGTDESVPIAAVHLVGVGESQGVTRVVEAVLVVPPFPYAIASSGPIRSQGGVLIAGIPEGAEPTLDVDELEPADLLSNNTSEDSIRLGADTTVSGDVHSAGGIVFDDPSIQVLGEVRTQASPENIPQISADDYDPAVLGMEFTNLTTRPGDQNGGGSLLAGTVRSSESVSFNDGLTLDGATLFVDGDLTINGGLEGSGVIVVKGRTTISGGVQLDTENQVAILSESDIVLTGHGPLSSRFQGLLYTEGALRAEQVSLVGTLVARGDEGVTLSETYVYQEKKQTVVPTPPTQAGNDMWEWDLLYQVGGKTRPGILGNGLFVLIPASDPNNPTIRVEFDRDVGFTPYLNGVSLGDFEQGNQASFVGHMHSELFTVMENMAGQGILTDKELEDESLRIAMSIAQQIRVGSGGNGGTTVVEEHFGNLLSLGPSQFLKTEERIRLALWRER